MKLSTPPVSPSPYLPMSRRWVSPLYLRVEDIPEYQTLDQSERSRLAALATALGLAATGGSDDHGSFKDTGLGVETTPPAEYERLLAMATAVRPVREEPR